MSILTHINPRQEKPLTFLPGRSKQAGRDVSPEQKQHNCKLPVDSADVVLVALPMRETSWLEVVEAAIVAGADFILADEKQTPAQLAEQAARQNATVIAATERMWKDICEQLAGNFRHQQRLRGIVLGRDGKLAVGQRYIIIKQ